MSYEEYVKQIEEAQQHYQERMERPWSAAGEG